MASKVVVLSHGDADGVCAAAIAKAALGAADVYFTHPVGLLEDFKTCAGSAEAVVVLDISLDESSLDSLRREFENFPGKVIYVDHHPLPLHAKLELPNLEFVHEEGPCAAELAFRRFKPAWDLSRVALYGAIGDYALNTQFVRTTMTKWDIKTLYLEAGVLVLALDRIGRNYELKRRVVDELSGSALPSSVPQLLELAAEQARRIEVMRLKLPELVRTLEHVAYITGQLASVGLAAFYAAVVAEKPVGVAVEERKGMYAGSVRALDGRVDLNGILRRLAPRYSGSGGGHPRAAGFRVPISSFEAFLWELDREVGGAIQ